MKNILNAIKLLDNLERLPLETVVKDFEKYTNQKVPQKAINNFTFTGLLNEDFLTSDFLNKYGLKNLLQFENTLT